MSPPGAVASIAFALCGLALPPTAQAAITTFGSSLSAPANLEKARGEDTAYWSTAFGGAGSPRTPASGQIRAIRLKGTAVKPTGASADPDNRIHFQTLRPRPDGSLQVIATSQEFRVPFTGDANQVNTFHPENMCAAAGDHIAFNTIGGFNPDGGYSSGTPFRIFSAVAGSSTRQFSSNEGTGNGAIFPPPPTVTHPSGLNTEHPRTELLMQVELGTGPDASAGCGGGGSGGAGGAPGPFYGLLLPRVQTSLVSRRRVALIRARCESRAVIGCGGTVTLVTKRALASARRRVELGSGRFQMLAGASPKVRVRLSRRGARLLRRRRRLAAIARVVAYDVAGRRKTGSSAVVLKLGRR